MTENNPAHLTASWAKVQRELAALVKPLIDRHFRGFDRALAFRDKLRGKTR